MEDDDEACPFCESPSCDGGCEDGFPCGRFDQSAPGGMWPVGMCRLAGTEECDFECPHRG